jgi:hypothetical protein
MFACQLRKLRWLSQFAHHIYPSLAGDRLGYPRLSPIQCKHQHMNPGAYLKMYSSKANSEKVMIHEADLSVTIHPAISVGFDRER